MPVYFQVLNGGETTFNLEHLNIRFSANSTIQVAPIVDGRFLVKTSSSNVGLLARHPYKIINQVTMMRVRADFEMLPVGELFYMIQMMPVTQEQSQMLMNGLINYAHFWQMNSRPLNTQSEPVVVNIVAPPPPVNIPQPPPPGQ